MLQGIEIERCAQMTDQEVRLFENVKKAFCESDTLYAAGRPQDCMEPMCKAIDTAKTLRRSLRGEDTSYKEQGRRFKDFIDLEVPGPESGGLNIVLHDARTGEPRAYSFSSLVYAIRCMVHENENLNATEKPDYHILLEWPANPDLNAALYASTMGIMGNGRITCYGPLVWGRLRQMMAKFITGMDSMIAWANGADKYCISIKPPLGSIRPKNR